MLTISKPLSAGQAQTYHKEEFANAEENYYSKGDRIRGEWHGRLAEEWGLRGEVQEKHFQRLANGQHPLTEEQLVRHQTAREYLNARGETVRCSSSALYHLFLLSVVAFSWHGAQSLLLSLHPRAITSALWLRGGGIRGHAGTFSLAHHRTGRRNSVYGDAGVEATHGSCSAAPRKRRDRRQRSLFPDEPRLAFWQARFYDFNLWTTKKRREKLRYMHRNPVKRGLVESPEQWRWSSYRFYCLGESGPVRINGGWGEISFRNRVA